MAFFVANSLAPYTCNCIRSHLVKLLVNLLSESIQYSHQSPQTMIQVSISLPVHVKIHPAIDTEGQEGLQK